MINAIIDVSADEYDFECFKVEEKKGDRSEFKVEQKQDKIIFTIQSKDPTALRATLNQISKLLITYKKTKELENE